ncbi:RNA polymerase II associated protein 1 [Allomyces arbusculus]|nr:RNA polymerase II associated protein 1 [Allomyces arbusculus]
MEGHPLRSMLRPNRTGCGRTFVDDGDDLEAMQRQFLEKRQQQQQHELSDHDDDQGTPSLGFDESVVPPGVQNRVSLAAARAVRTKAPPVVRSTAAGGSSRTNASVEQPSTHSERRSVSFDRATAPAAMPATATASPAPPKKLSLFAQRRAAAASAAAAAKTLSASPKRDLLPPLEEIKVPVVTNDIRERHDDYGDVDTPSSDRAVRFAAPSTGFPQAVHRSEVAESARSGSPQRKSLAARIAETFSEPTGLDDEHAGIHRESLGMIEQMSADEIRAAQEHFLSTLDPAIVQMLQSRAKAKFPNVAAVDSETETEQGPENSTMIPQADQPKYEIPPITEPAELRKLEWTGQTEPNTTSAAAGPDPIETTDTDPNNPLNLGRELEGSQLRFDFSGRLLTKDVARSLPTHLGLHHHGDDPSLAGYTVPELLHLSHSTVPGQRQISARILGHVVARLWAFEYPVVEHNQVVDLLLDLQGILHLRTMLDDPTRTVLDEAVLALTKLLGATEISASASSICDAFHLVALEKLVHVPDDEATIQDHAGMLRLNLPRGLVDTDVVARVAFLLQHHYRATEPEFHWLVNVLFRLCAQSREACQQVMDQPALVRALVAPLSKMTWPSTEVRDMSYATVVVRLFQHLAQHASAFVQQTHGLWMTSVVKFLSVPVTDDAGLGLQREVLQLMTIVFSYGVHMNVQEVCQMAFELRSPATQPATYLVARAIIQHLPDFAILTVPIVDKAYLLLTGEEGRPLAAATSSDLANLECLVAALNLIAARRVKAPIKALVEATKALVIRALELIPMSAPDEPSVPPAPKRHFFAVFPSPTAMFAVQSPELRLVALALQGILQHLPETHDAVAVLDVIEDLFCQVFHLGTLEPMALLAPLATTWLQYADFQSPLHHALAYFAVTFFPMPMEANHKAFVQHLVDMEPTSAWHALDTLLVPQITQPTRDSLFIPVGAAHHSLVWPPAILPRNWLAKAAHQDPSKGIPLLAQVLQWLDAVVDDQLPPVIVPEDLFPLFVNEAAPYLDAALAPHFATIAALVGPCGIPASESAQTQFDAVVDAYLNVSYHAPAFQALLATALLQSPHTDVCFVTKFFDEVGKARAARHLTWSGSERPVTAAVLAWDEAAIAPLLRVLPDVPVASFWYGAIALQIHGARKAGIAVSDVVWRKVPEAHRRRVAAVRVVDGRLCAE